MLKEFRVTDDCQVNGIDVIYKRYFNNIDLGFFVEVGAYDGKSWSNTSFLADIGWSGIYIEPITRFSEECKKNHINNNVIIENCAVGNIEGELIIHEGGCLSTLSSDVKQINQNNNQNTIYIDEVKCNTYRLDTILKKHNVEKQFEILVVDTEGYEYEVFRSFSFNDYRPKMIIVELCDIHPAFAMHDIIKNNAMQTRQYIKNNSYVEIYVDCINTIFVDAIFFNNMVPIENE